MTWYKTGTVSLAQGSNAVIGAGTSFIANSRVGDAFRGPDGEWYEVTNIASDIALSIAPSYQGEPVSGGVYSLAPMQGYVKDSADALRAATSVIASGVANMQEQVTAATEAAATAVQAEAVAVAKADIATAAADLSTQNKESTSQDATSAGQAALRAEAARDAVVGSEEAAAASAQAAAESAEEAEIVTRGKAASGANSDITSLSGLTTALSVEQGGTGSTTGVPTLVGATASTAGAKGLVPAPAAGDQLKFLRGDGTFQAVTVSTAWGGVTGTLSAQADLQAALDLKLDKSDATPIKSYASPDQTITPGGSLTLLHQLGSEPFEVQGFIVCRDADAEYAVGDVVPVPHFAVDYAYNYGVSLVTSSTNIFCRFGTAAGAFFVLRKTTATTVGIVPAKWRFIVRART
ncbi:hypothetical protein [Pseudomonas sp. MF4836]|uniref:hypothetical protein n=1 Tax=Pseudomonas sp. MF4836 TaxID=1960827 RepID=UPI001EE757F5|nr:hypothetical protein [Pseudomonas sp. MF4836]